MIFQKIANNSSPTSLATRFREKRFSFFLSLLSQVERPVSILDVGGTEYFWNMMGISNLSDVKITLLNTSDCMISNPNISFVIGDACDLKFLGESFDVIFSNSVIEHVGNRYNQKQMANEVKRVGKRYFIQTPNKNFFLEPHFLFPFFQFMPSSIQVWLVRNFKLGWYERKPIVYEAKSLLDSVNLLSKKELIGLFPEGNLYEEKFLGLTKSFIVFSGWDSLIPSSN